MCEGIGGYRYVSTWEDIDVSTLDDTYVSTWENADMSTWEVIHM